MAREFFRRSKNISLEELQEAVNRQKLKNERDKILTDKLYRKVTLPLAEVSWTGSAVALGYMSVAAFSRNEVGQGAAFVAEAIALSGLACVTEVHRRRVNAQEFYPPEDWQPPTQDDQLDEPT